MDIFDCIIIGAGPGGLQAAIHLARYNRKVMLIDQGGGRTKHAVHIENYLGHTLITGKSLIETGLTQITNFNVAVHKSTVTHVVKNSDNLFEIITKDQSFFTKFLIASSGARENLPRLKNLQRFWGTSFFTCVDCDGFRTTGKKLLIMGKDLNAVRISFAMKEMFTRDITLVLTDYALPPEYQKELEDEKIMFVPGTPTELYGEKTLEGIKLNDGNFIQCDVIMASYGYTLNDAYLSGLPLERDGNNFKIITNHNNESSIDKLYVLGALSQGNAQAIIAAGEGAAAAIEINKRLLDL